METAIVVSNAFFPCGYFSHLSDAVRLQKWEKEVQKFSRGNPWSKNKKQEYVFLRQTYSSKVRNSSSIERVHILKAHTPKQSSEEDRRLFTDLHTCKKWTIVGERMNCLI